MDKTWDKLIKRLYAMMLRKSSSTRNVEEQGWATLYPSWINYHSKDPFTGKLTRMDWSGRESFSRWLYDSELGEALRSDSRLTLRPQKPSSERRQQLEAKVKQQLTECLRGRSEEYIEEFLSEVDIDIPDMLWEPGHLIAVPTKEVQFRSYIETSDWLYTYKTPFPDGPSRAKVKYRGKYYLSVDDLADCLGVSPRTAARRLADQRMAESKKSTPKKASDTNPTPRVIRSRLTSLYNNIRQRCTNPANPSYERYGGSGVTICEEWNTLDKFLDSVVSLPGYSDYIENKEPYVLHRSRRLEHRPTGDSLDYSPDNCWFIPSHKAGKLARSLYTPTGWWPMVDGVPYYCLEDIAKEFRVSQADVRRWFTRGVRRGYLIGWTTIMPELPF